MITNNLDSLARKEYFLDQLTKLSLETGIQIGNDEPTNCITEHDKLNGEYMLENSHCFGFEHSKGV